MSEATTEIGEATTDFYERSVAGTDEGDQQLKPRSELSAKELLREVGSVLRMSEAEAALLGDLPDDPDRRTPPRLVPICARYSRPP